MLAVVRRSISPENRPTRTKALWLKPLIVICLKDPSWQGDQQPLSEGTDEGTAQWLPDRVFTLRLAYQAESLAHRGSVRYQPVSSIAASIVSIGSFSEFQNTTQYTACSPLLNSEH